MIEFKRKSKEELDKLTTPRLKAYHKAERKRFYRSSPGPCSCGSVFCNNPWDDLPDEDKEQMKAWDEYCNFVCALLNDRDDYKVEADDVLELH